MEEVSDMKKNDALKYGLGGIVLGGIAVWLITMLAINSGNIGMMQMMGFRTTEQEIIRNSDIVDVHFIEQMIPHHEDAITMAELAQTKAERPEIKQLAKNIIVSQSKEIDKMKSWYEDWFGREVPTGEDVMNIHGMVNSTRQNFMHMGIRGDNSDMIQLEQADDFDVAFVELMIPHHQMAVMMASMLKDGTQRPEMSTLADDIMAAQMEEIEQMRQWLRDW